VRNLGFDVTPGALVTAIVTERSVARPPYDQSLPALMRHARNDGDVIRGSRAASAVDDIMPDGVVPRVA